MEKKIYLFTIIFFTIFINNIFATAQEPDLFFYNNEEYSLNSNPLERYFKKYPEKKPKDTEMKTSNWRGYIATFGVRDNKLWLEDITIEYYKERSNNMLLDARKMKIINTRAHCWVMNIKKERYFL